MNKIKVQFIGIKDIPNKKDDEIFRARKVKLDTNGYQTDEYLSFHDYHIVFINYPFKYPYPSEPTGFLDYISGGGIVVIFLGYSPYEYPWGKRFLNVSASRGYSIIPDAKHWLKDIFKKYHFTWGCMLSPDDMLFLRQKIADLEKKMENVVGERRLSTEKVFEIAGTTISGKCISAVIHYDSGKLILLPIPEKMSVDLIRELLDGIKNNYFKKDEIPEIRPPWIESWNLQPELKLKGEMDAIISQYIKIKKQIEWYESIKKILYSQGKELSFSVNLILKEMGFEAVLKEEEGYQDIEIKLNNFFAFIEVKGLKGFANNEHVRQLLEYVIKSEKYPEVKGIFIVNHFRDKEPSERDMPYSEAAITIAKKNEFCLLTTVDLFKMYKQFLDGKITTEQIKNLIQTTKGLLQYQT